MVIKQPENTFVLSLGGSVFAPNGQKSQIDIGYLHAFDKFIRKQIALKRRFFIVTGGGYTARQYRDAAAQAAGSHITDEDLDWVGVHATRLNAHLFRTVFRDIAYPWVLKHYEMVDKKALSYPVVMCAGWKPGWSTDYCAVTVAEDYKIKTVINLSNIDSVYDKDPLKNADAKPIEKMKWNELVKIVGSKWRPGLNSPFDPIASKLAQNIQLKVIVCNGRKLDNLERILTGKSYQGTTIE
ncbi:MAG: UMP kinase [Patescibacteria group bacterium]|nr:UMP kinase [Patescibacteria group bacterium]